MDEINDIITKHKVVAQSTNISDKEMLYEMLQLEEKIRMSQAYTRECDNVKDEVNGWLRISESIQFKIVKKFGFLDIYTQTLAVNQMRRAHVMFKDDKRFHNVSVYVRNNLAREGKLVSGDAILDVDLTDLDNKTIKLSDITCQSDKPTIVISSSET